METSEELRNDARIAVELVQERILAMASSHHGDDDKDDDKQKSGKELKENDEKAKDKAKLDDDDKSKSNNRDERDRTAKARAAKKDPSAPAAARTNTTRTVRTAPMPPSNSTTTTTRPHELDLSKGDYYRKGASAAVDLALTPTLHGDVSPPDAAAAAACFESSKRQSPPQPQQPVAVSCPGAVRVAGMNHSQQQHSSSLLSEDDPYLSQQSLFYGDSMDASDPDASPSMPFEPIVPIEATLVSASEELRYKHYHHPSSHPPLPIQPSGHLYLEAQPVVPSEEHELELKDVVSNKKVCIKLLLGIGLLILVAVGITVGVVIGTTDSKEEGDPHSLHGPDSPDDSVPANTATPAPYDPFNSSLPPTILDQISNLPNSPQSRANAWLLEDPNFDTLHWERQHVRFALATLYYGAQGENWNNSQGWLDYDVHECDWYTSHPTSPCSDDGEYFHTLNLSSNALKGNLFVDYPLLQVLDVSNNALSGAIPTRPTSTSLEVFVVSHNQFNKMPLAELGLGAPNLRVLQVNGNQIPGQMPNGLGILTPNLEVLDASDNNLTGPLPDAYGDSGGSLWPLKVLKFAGNQLEGTLSDSWGDNLPSLEWIDLSDNRGLSGTIPESYGRLPNLTVFHVDETNVTGPIPEALCTRPELDVLADCGDQVTCCQT